MKQVILIGPRGVGKTSIGIELAKLLEIEFINIDTYIHQNLIFPAKDIYTKEEFEKKQEIEFNVLKDFIYSKKEVVISNGAGLLQNQTSKRLIEIKEVLKEKNVILLFPYTNFMLSKIILEKRTKQKLKIIDIETSFLLHKKFTKKIFFTKNLNIKEIAKELLKII
ncbi:MAG: hypothetical protein PF569_07480 [Candidatus Woesearchaeota archaeon]|jgi:shikimate kinase|nr:hypothetical protein [Candidatus Woesearchaeota archaeon]